MKKNIEDLPEVLKMARSFGAGHFMVTNLLPYSPEMNEEILYRETIAAAPLPELKPVIRMPLMDITAETEAPLLSALRWGRRL